MEVWKPVKGYEQLYEVSNLGRVRSCANKTTFSMKHGKRTWKQRILKQKSDKQSYKRVTLYKDKKQKTFLVHRLVAEAFLPNPENKPIINHKDGNPPNNEWTNLEWCTYRDNLMHAFANKMNKNPVQVTLKNKKTGKEYKFYSMAEASRFAGKNHGFVSRRIKSKNYEFDGWTIQVS